MAVGYSRHQLSRLTLKGQLIDVLSFKNKFIEDQNQQVVKRKKPLIFSKLYRFLDSYIVSSDNNIVLIIKTDQTKLEMKLIIRARSITVVQNHLYVLTNFGTVYKLVFEETGDRLKLTSSREINFKDKVRSW